MHIKRRFRLPCRRQSSSLFGLCQSSQYCAQPDDDHHNDDDDDDDDDAQNYYQIQSNFLDFVE